MVKRTLFILICIVSQTSLISQTKAHIDPENGFKFNYYQDWNVTVKDGRTGIFAPQEGINDTENENWGISISSSFDKTVDECYQEYIIESFPDTFEDFKIINQGESLLEKVKFKWIEYSFIENGLNIKNLTYIAVHKENLFVLIGYSGKKKYDEKYGDLFRKMIESFRFTK